MSLSQHATEPDKRSATTPDSLDEETRGSSVPPDRQISQERLEQLLGVFGAIDGFYAKVDRIQRHQFDEVSGYLGAMDFAATFLDDVVALHGGGKYRARIHNARGRYQTSFTFTLGGAARPKPIAQPVAGPRRSIASLTSRLGTIRARAQDHQLEIDSVRWFTPQRLAARWDLSVTTVAAIPREQLPYKEFGAGTELKRRRYHPDDVAAYEASDRPAANSAVPA